MEPRVRDLMRRAFIRVAPDEGLEAVCRLMAMARVRELPVVDGDRLTGMVSQRELARAALGHACRGDGAPSDETIAAFVRPVEPISPEAPLPEAARRMVDGQRPCLPAAESVGGAPRIVGLLVEGDLLRAAYRGRP